jgi:hypothetical protein
MTEPEQRILQSHGRWVPDIFRQPWVLPAPHTGVPALTPEAEVEVERLNPRTVLLLSGAAVGVLILLAGLSLLLGG